MKYRGFVIKPVFKTDCRPSRDGSREWETFNTKIISHYKILDPVEGGRVWICEDTLPEAKRSIDQFLSSSNMKDNLLSSWEKLTGYIPSMFNPVDINALDKEATGVHNDSTTLCGPPGIRNNT